MLPATRDSTPPIAIAADAELVVTIVKNDVVTAFVVTPTPICVSNPPVVASTAYIPLSLSSFKILFSI